MDQEKINGENTEQMLEQTAEEPAAAPEEIAVEDVIEAAEEAAVETAEEAEEAEEKEEEAPAEEAAKAPDWKEKLAGFKKSLGAFLKKVNPVVDAPEEQEEAAQEPEEQSEQEESVQEETVSEEMVAEAPVRRKPADAFAIDFPIEEEVVKEETSEEEQQEETTQPEETEAAEVVAQESETQVSAPKKPVKPFLLGLMLGGCVLMLGVLAFFVLKGAGIDIGPRPNDVYYKASYTATEETLAKKADTVVATLGDRQLTLSELQLYYVNSIYVFYTQNYYYMSMMGLDLSQPLDQQYYLGEENMTWEQFFLDAALTSWQNYTVAEVLAERDNFTMAPELQAQIDGMAAQLDSIAAAYGYESAAAYLNAEMAPGITPETYINFNRVYFVSNEYVSNFYETQYPTPAEIIAYYKENQQIFDANGITQDIGLVSSVRHILIKPKGGTTDEAGVTTYSEDEWATALSEAERILKQWQDGEATEESFAVLANTYSEDGGSNTTGGLYEDVHIDSNYVPEFKNWAIDVARKSGDVEIVRTTHGYHIMYFVSGEDYFQRQVGQQLVAERIQEKLLAVKEELPMEVNYKKILLCEGSVV